MSRWLLWLGLLLARHAAAHPADEPIVLLSLGVHDRGLRYEIDLPRSTLEAVSGWSLAGDASAVKAILEKSFLELYRGKNPVFVDGEEVAPALREAGLLEASREEEATPLEDPLVYLVLDYASARPPGRVDLTWTWTEVLDRAGVRKPMARGDLTGAGGFETVELDRERRIHSWKRKAAGTGATGSGEPAPVGPPATETLARCLLAGIVASLLLGAWRRRWLVPLLVASGLGFWYLGLRTYGRNFEATRVTHVTRGLIEEIYRSLDGRSEGEVYDLLAKRMDGELLDRTYREIHEGLFLDHAEKKSTVRILSVDVAETTPLDWVGGLLDDPALRVRCRWRVRGLVVHTGHVHARTREFSAIYTVGWRDGAWKLIDCEVLDLERGTAEPLTGVTPSASPGAAR